jgi:hypothetical protein
MKYSRKEDNQMLQDLYVLLEEAGSLQNIKVASFDEDRLIEYMVKNRVEKPVICVISTDNYETMLDDEDVDSILEISSKIEATSINDNETYYVGVEELFNKLEDSNMKSEWAYMLGIDKCVYDDNI